MDEQSGSQGEPPPQATPARKLSHDSAHVWRHTIELRLIARTNPHDGETRRRIRASETRPHRFPSYSCLTGMPRPAARHADLPRAARQTAFTRSRSSYLARLPDRRTSIATASLRARHPSSQWSFLELLRSTKRVSESSPARAGSPAPGVVHVQAQLTDQCTDRSRPSECSDCCRAGRGRACTCSSGTRRCRHPERRHRNRSK